MRLLQENCRKTLNPSPIRDGEIDLWCVCLEHDQPSIDSFFDSLSEDEKQRANRFVFARDREHFIVGRGTLRTILGGYLGRRPEKISFSYNGFGKPRLAEQDGGLRFNVSHSRGIGLVAVTKHRKVGIDIEYVDREFDVLSVAESAFAPDDAARLKSLPAGSRTAAFFERWTRKEAALKAMGDGLSSSAEHQSAVSAMNDEQGASFTTSTGEKVTDWTVTSLKTADEYKAALAVEGKMGSLRYLQLGDYSLRNGREEAVPARILIAERLQVRGPSARSAAILGRISRYHS